jgi:hypothetical protein
MGIHLHKPIARRRILCRRSNNKKWRETMSKAFLALAAGLLPATGLSAAELWPGRGASLALGDVSGMAYYTAEPDGYCVVATLAAGESTTPVRFITVLQPGQKSIVSVPGAPGGRETAVEIARVGDKVHVTTEPNDGPRVVGAD